MTARASGWREVRLQPLVTITSGQSPSGFRFGADGFPYFKVEQLNRSEKYLDRRTTPYLSREVPTVPAGSVVFAKRGAAIALNRIRILGEAAFMDTNVMALTPRAGVGLEPEFLFYSLQHRGLADIADTTSIPQINNKHINPLRLGLPRPAEQRRIVDVLSSADDHVSTLDTLIAKKVDIKHGLTHDLLTGRMRLAGFTGRWSTHRLGDHVTYLKSVPLSRADMDRSSAVRCLHYGDIHTSRSSHLDAASVPLPRAAATKVLTAGRLAPGDVVFADASEDPAGVGKSVEITAVPAAGLVAGLHTIAARFDKSVLADGFKGYLQFHPGLRKALLRLAAGTKVLATNRGAVASVELALPPVTEQVAIAAVLHEADAELEALRARRAKARDVKQGLMQELLTGRARLPGAEHDDQEKAA